MSTMTLATAQNPDMSPRDFVIWLEGFLAGRSNIAYTDFELLKEKLNTVSKVESFSGQQNLQPLSYKFSSNGL